MSSSESASSASTSKATTTTDAITLDTILTEGMRSRDEEQRAASTDIIDALITEVMAGTMTVSDDTQAMLNARIGQIDTILSKQLNAIMHHEDFQKLEASWRGLNYFVKQSETGENLKIRVLNVSKKDLLKSMERAPEFDKSDLFKKVYEEEYGTFGGKPYGALIGDYEFSRHPQDVALLEKIAGVAAAAHAPFLSAASSQLFNLDDFTELSDPHDLTKIFSTPEYVKYRSFRESEDSRYVGLCLPHILMRLPYGADTCPVEAFNFEEAVDGTDHSKYLWGNAAYALGTRLTDAFAKHNWCAAIRGVKGGGLVEGLPTHTFPTDQGEIALKCPTEIAITDRREKELSDLGFIPLVHCKDTDYAAFFAVQSTQRAAKYNTDDANANARLSTQLQYIMAVSRFAHYLKAMMRDYVGSFMTRADTDFFLNKWITQYVTSPTENQEIKAKKPLSEARIDVMEVPGKPGCYQAVAFLKPHYQLDELTVSLSLVAQLPPALQ